MHRGRIFAHACKSRRAPRPRKHTGSVRVESPSSPREGCSTSTGIRLVMLVRSPKFWVRFKSKSRILGEVNFIPSGGGVPEGRRGSLTPMSEDDSLFISPSTPYLLSEYPRDEQLIRSVFEHDEQLDRARLNTTNPLPEPAGGLLLPCQGTAACFSPSTTHTPSERPRDEQPIRSVPRARRLR